MNLAGPAEADTASAAVPPPATFEDEPPSRIIGGVATLIAQRFDVDALWVRIGFVLMALVGGVGVLVYAALWLAFVVGARPERRWVRVTGGIALVLGVPLALSRGFNFIDGPIAVVSLLVGLAVALWQPGRTAATTSSWRAPADSQPLTTEVEVAEPLGAAPAPRSRLRYRVTRARRRRPRSVVGRATLGFAVIVAAVGALIDQANGGRMHPEQWFGAAAIVCGCGLLVGALFFGRALWLVVPAAVFAGTGFVAGIAARVGLEPTTLVGDSYVYVSSETPSGGIRRAHVVVGSVHVNIDGRPAAPVTVDARTGIGDVRIMALEDVAVEVRAAVEHGRVLLDGFRREEGTVTIGPDRQPDVIVIAETGRGKVEISREERFVPEDMSMDQAVAPGVVLTDGGQIILGGGEAVLDADGTPLTGALETRDSATIIVTSLGEFQVLPGALLLTPEGELLDLQQLWDERTPG